MGAVCYLCFDKKEGGREGGREEGDVTRRREGEWQNDITHTHDTNATPPPPHLDIDQHVALLLRVDFRQLLLRQVRHRLDVPCRVGGWLVGGA